MRKEDWTVWSCRHLPVEVEVKEEVTQGGGGVVECEGGL